MGVLALVVALELNDITGSLFLAYTIFTSGILIPVIEGCFKNRLKVNSPGAIAAITGGGTALAVDRGDVENLELPGFGVCIVLPFSVSWITWMTGLGFRETRRCRWTIQRWRARNPHQFQACRGFEAEASGGERKATEARNQD